MTETQIALDHAENCLLQAVSLTQNNNEIYLKTEKRALDK